MIAARTAITDAELIALGIGHENPVPAMLGHHVRFQALCADLFEPSDQTLNVGHLDVNVHPVLPGLVLRNALKKQLWARPAVGKQ